MNLVYRYELNGNKSVTVAASNRHPNHHPYLYLGSQESGNPPMKPEAMLELFENINKTEAKMAAIFDVMTSQVRISSRKI